MNKPNFASLVLAILIALLGIVSTYWLSLQVKDQLQAQQHTKLEAIAQQVSVRLQDATDLAINELLALQSLYVSDENVSLRKFETFTQRLLNNRHGHIQALEWIPQVRGENRDAFEAKLQQRFPDFHITERNDSGQLVPSAERSIYYPVTYIAPYEANRSAHGFDLNSNAVRRASLNFSRDSGEMATTAGIRLVQEKGESFGVLIFAPVYKYNIVIEDNAGARAQALHGYVLGVFRLNSLMNTAHRQADKENLILALLDRGGAKDTLLYGEEIRRPDFRFDITTPNRSWQLQVSLNDALKAKVSSPQVVNWIQLGGAVLSLLLGFCIYALKNLALNASQIKLLSLDINRQNSKLEMTVTERTNALAEKNQVLSKNVDKLTQQRRILSSLMEDAQAAKNQAEQRAAELARSNRDLDDFAYVASHDLKSPLRGIDQLASWVVEDLEAGDFTEIPEHLRLMRQRVQRLETLLSDLLEFSRVSRHEARLAMVDTALLFTDFFALNSPPPNFTLSILGDLPVFLTAPVPFEQVVRNLLGNAIKHHDRDDGHIEVSCCDMGEYYRFAIKDDGPGISAEYHDQIFKMFKTLKPRDETEGSGMGLALIKRIVENYSGEVDLESSLKLGSTFYFTWRKTV